MVVSYHVCCLQELPDSFQQLIRLAQAINFGRAQFSVKAGQPDFTQPVRTVRIFRPAGDRNSPRIEGRSVDFELRKEVKTLLDKVAQARDGAAVTIKIEHGLPVQIEIEEEHKA